MLCKLCGKAFPLSKCSKDESRYELFCDFCWENTKNQCRAILENQGKAASPVKSKKLFKKAESEPLLVNISSKVVDEKPLSIEDSTWQIQLNKSDGAEKLLPIKKVGQYMQKKRR